METNTTSELCLSTAILTTGDAFQADNTDANWEAYASAVAVWERTMGRLYGNEEIFNLTGRR